MSEWAIPPLGKDHPVFRTMLEERVPKAETHESLNLRTKLSLSKTESAFFRTRSNVQSSNRHWTMRKLVGVKPADNPDDNHLI